MPFVYVLSQMHRWRLPIRKLRHCERWLLGGEIPGLQVPREHLRAVPCDCQCLPRQMPRGTWDNAFVASRVFYLYLENYYFFFSLICSIKLMGICRSSAVMDRLDMAGGNEQLAWTARKLIISLRSPHRPWSKLTSKRQRRTKTVQLRLLLLVYYCYTEEIENNFENMLLLSEFVIRGKKRTYSSNPDDSEESKVQYKSVIVEEVNQYKPVLMEEVKEQVKTVSRVEVEDNDKSSVTKQAKKLVYAVDRTSGAATTTTYLNVFLLIVCISQLF